jgi:hypothetical protein
MLLELGTVVVDAAAAQALVSSQREAIVRALAKVDDEAEKTTGAQITCAEIAPGFHNCLLPGGRLLATVSSYGEVYRTGCGV